MENPSPAPEAKQPYLNTRQRRREEVRRATKADQSARRIQPKPRYRLPTKAEELAALARALERSTRLSTGGAFGGPPKKAAKEKFLSASTAEGNRIARDRANARTYNEWIATLSAEELAFARSNGIDTYLSDRTGDDGSQESANTRDSADLLPTCETGTHNGRPLAPRSHPIIDVAEPLDAAPVAQFSPDQVREAADTFDTVLRWALSASGLVALGQRSAVMIAALRADLAGGLEVDRPLARSFIATFNDFRLSETQARLSHTGKLYSRILEWMRRGQSVSALGERVQLVAYKLRPDLLDAATLAQLGAEANKTRQAQNKIAGCMRDTFAGLIALCERPEITRLRCQSAQLSPA